MTRKPAAFRLDEPGVTLDAAPPVTALPPELDETALVPAPPPVKRGFPWGRIVAAALSAFVSVSFGLWATQVIEDLFARAQWLGWLASALLALALTALIAFILRELIGIARLSRVAHLREEADRAAAADDMAAAKRIVARVTALYAADPQTAQGRGELARHTGEIIDGRDRLRLAERHLLSLKDAEARALVTGAAKRVAAVTAISPRAAVDIVYVLWEAVRLIRRLATLYGGRPSGLGTVKLARMVVGHLALTGGVAMTDSIVQQLVGHGLAAKLSARLGEGVVNGMMTARIGLAALSVVRPLPFLSGRPPALSDIMAELTKVGAMAKTD